MRAIVGMGGVVGLLLLCGCGRFWFEAVSDASVDASGSDGATLDAAITDATTDDARADAAASDASDDATIDDAGVTDANDVDDASDDAATSDAAADAGNDAQVPVCTWSVPEEITGLNVTGSLWGPSLSQDGLTLYFARNDGTDEHIMVATRTDRGTQFSQAVAVPGVQSPQIDGTPHISADDRTLYFFTTRPGGGGGQDVWYATRASAMDPFDPPAPLPNVNTTSSEYVPHVSPDGLTLWVSSNRPGGAGSMDIWIATRSTPMENFATPSLWTELNTSAFEAAPTVSSDGLFVVFVSDRSGSQRLDLWMATRPDTSSPFGPPERLSFANTAENEADPILSADDSELFYSSDRDGSRKLWRLRRVCN